MILVQRQPILWIPAKSLVANADIKVATCKYFSKLVHWKISKSSDAILQRVFFFTRNMITGADHANVITLKKYDKIIM